MIKLLLFLKWIYSIVTLLIESQIKFLFNYNQKNKKNIKLLKLYQ